MVDEQLTGGLRHTADARMDNPGTYVMYPLKRRIPLSKASSNDDLLDFPVEQRRDKTSTSDIDITSQDKKRRTKANEKKRRVPVNGLALVPSLPTHSNSSPAAEVSVISSIGSHIIKGDIGSSNGISTIARLSQSPVQATKVSPERLWTISILRYLANLTTLMTKSPPMLAEAKSLERPTLES